MLREKNNDSKIVCVANRCTILTAAAPDDADSVYLAQVAGDAHIMPGVVIELAVDRLHQSLKGPRAQVDD